MKKIRLLWLPLVVALAFVATACPGQPSTGGSTTTPTTTPNGCVEANVIPLFGDSNGTQLPQYIHPDGYQVENKAQGGSAYTEEARATSFARGGPDLPTIITRVHDYVEACPPPTAIIVQGFTNDVGNSVRASTVIPVIAELNAYLAGKHIRTVWVSMQPVVQNGGWDSTQLGDMATYNAWLLTPGNVTGTVVDSTIPLRTSSTDLSLSQSWWTYQNLAPDIRHVNQAGYLAWANFITPLLLAELNT